MKDTCVFCKIARGEIPAKIVYENSKIIAFLDINPRNEGHTLVIPKAHYQSLLDMPEEILSELLIVAKELCEKMKNKLQAKGFNLVINIGKVAGQEVPHFHLHIIPRYPDDGEVIKFGEIKQKNLEEVYHKLCE
ncbi:MAG: HIT family protein [Thermoplasmata archaeon]|nr:MAG: HIT family protein [Thermoplasmata archaeon]